MRLILFLCLLLPGCAVVESPTTFAVCKTADVTTTAYALHHGFVEANPITKVLIAHGYIPLIAVSLLMWWVIDHYNEPALTVPANIVTCGVAVHNAILL